MSETYSAENNPVEHLQIDRCWMRACSLLVTFKGCMVVCFRNTSLSVEKAASGLRLKEIQENNGWKAIKGEGKS